jgi:hypothetical protein
VSKDDKPIAPEAAPVTSTDMAELIRMLGEKLSAAAISPDILREIMVESQKAAAAATQKAMKPENAEHPHVSAFSYPEGDILRPKPKLTRDTFFCGIREDEDRLTPSEILAYNAFVKDMESRGGSWRAEVIKPKSIGGKGVLNIWVPKDSVDQRMMLPHQLTLLLHELNGGPSTQDISSLLAQIEHLKGALAKRGMTAAELEATLLGEPVPVSA